MSTQSLSRSHLFWYSFIALPLAFAGLPLYMHAPDFYTRSFALDLTLIGSILLFVRLIDAFQDPLIGYLSDKYAHARASIIYIGAVLLMLGMTGLFVGPLFELPVAVWFAVFVILATTGFSIVTINLTLVGGFWVDASAARTRISAWREGLGLVGLLLAASLPSVFQQTVSTKAAYLWMTLCFAALFIIGIRLFTHFLHQLGSDHPVKRGFGESSWGFWSLISGHERRFFIIYFINQIATAMPAVLVLFFIQDYLQATALSGLFLVCYFLSGAIGMPVWMKLSAQFGQTRTWLFSMVLAVLTFFWAYTLQSGDIFAYGVICVLSGLALGADLAIPPALMANRIAARHAQTQATQYFALMAFIPKLTLALVSGVALMLLGQSGFEAGETVTEQAASTLLLLYALLPCLIKIIAAFLLWRFHQQEGTQHDTVQEDNDYGSTRLS